MKYSFTATLFTIFILFSSAYGQIYVSTTGNDTNPGTFEQPLKTIPAAVTKAQPGDTIYVRGGVYTSSTTISISKDGTADNMYHLFAYPGERPLLDFSSQNFGTRGIRLSGDYWYIKGFDIKGSGDNGMNISGSYNTIEFCSLFENRDTGMQMDNGASHNSIINCDSYYNADPSDYRDADGFAPKLTVGTGNYFYGCRAWGNVDDGWDGYMRGEDDVTTTLENCWAFWNGYLKDGTDPGPGANGNGFKMGGSDDKNLMHNFILYNCLAFDNKARGFDQNSNIGSMTIYNGTAYRNGTNYSIATAISAGKTATVVNSVAHGSVGSLASFVVQQTNSWMPGFTVDNSDFISIDTAGVRGPRKTDGSLPDITFLHLAEGSDLVDAGTDVGLPFDGAKPDLGAFETGLIVPVELTAFSADVRDNFVYLKWVTQTETNNLGFEVLRTPASGSPLSEGGSEEYNIIGFVPGSGTSAETREYLFVDKNISQGRYYYKLKQIDYDGSFSFSEEILISNSILAKFSLHQNYPNPFNPATNFEFQVSDFGFVSLKIYDLLGNEVAVLVNEVKEPGVYQVKFNAKDLSTGMYVYTLKQGVNVQSRKMLLVK